MPARVAPRPAVLSPDESGHGEAHSGDSAAHQRQKEPSEITEVKEQHDRCQYEAINHERHERTGLKVAEKIPDADKAGDGRTGNSHREYTPTDRDWIRSPSRRQPHRLDEM